MAIPNPKHYSFKVASDIQEILKNLRRLKNDHSDIIIEIVETDQLFYLQDLKHKSFCFFIGVPEKKSNGDPTIFPIYHTPIGLHSTNPYASQGDKDEVVKDFNEWIDILKAYNSISFEEDDEFLKHYEDEIFADFINIDEDASIKPFDNNQQIILYKFLETTSKYLANEFPENQTIKEIVDETENLKNNISTLTKKVASRKFSKILAKIRKFNPITYNDVYEVAKKEVIKYLLLKGVETLPKLVTGISHLLGS